MWLVFKKELLELLRDRKTLFFMIALPMLFLPVIFGAMAYFSGKAVKDAQEKTLSYALVGYQHSPELQQALSNLKGLKQVAHQLQPDDEEGIKAFIKAEKAEFVLVIPADFNLDILAQGQNNLQLYFNDAGLNAVERRLNKAIQPLADNAQLAAFAALGVAQAQQDGLLKPIEITKVNVADKREDLGEKLGGLVPYMIFILCLQGAMLPATDIGAGEKERGTLETLLISPIPRVNLVMGKFFTIAFAGVTSALITVGSMALWGLIIGQGMAIKFLAEFLAAISYVDFLLMFLMLVPVVAIFAAVLLSLSIYARSFKEAQGYMGPMMIFVIVPVVIAMMPGVNLTGVYAWIPLTNVALAIKELIKGTMDYMQLIPIFVSTAAIAGALTYFCVTWFNKEKVLFR